MTSHKIVIVCPEASQCCGMGKPCYADRCKSNFNINYPGIEVEVICEPDDPFVLRHGIKRFPAFIFMKGEVVAAKRIGKYMDDTIHLALKQLRWIE